MFDWVLNTPLYYSLLKYIEDQRTNPQRLSSVKVSDKTYYRVIIPNRFIIRRDKTEQQSNSS